VLFIASCGGHWRPRSSLNTTSICFKSSSTRSRLACEDRIQKVPPDPGVHDVFSSVILPGREAPSLLAFAVSIQVLADPGPVAGTVGSTSSSACSARER
jgi:hypothetical protein